MYEVDFTGWTRTPEDIKYLKEKRLQRLKFHWNRVVKSFQYKRGWYNIKSCIFDLIKNSKNI